MRQIEEISLIRKKLDSIDRSTKSIVASEEAIKDALSAIEGKAERYLTDISYGLEGGLETLGAVFEWGMAEVVYHLELQRKELKRIVEILEAPLETQAKELRRRAEFAHRNGWVDEALADFLEAEKKNYADFTVHQSLGNIYLGKNNLTKAEEYYKKAAKYARPHSPYYTSYALWHLGRVKYLQGETLAAYEATKRATTLWPNLNQALYDHARYSALLGKEEEALANLRSAIQFDRNYALKALADEAFSKMIPALKTLLQTFKQEAKQRAEIGIKCCRECLSLVARSGGESLLVDKELTQSLRDLKKARKRLLKEARKRFGDSDPSLEEEERSIDDFVFHRDFTWQVRELDALMKKDSFFDFLDAGRLAEETLTELVRIVKMNLTDQENNLSQQIRNVEDAFNYHKHELMERVDSFVAWLIFMGILFSLFSWLIIVDGVSPLTIFGGVVSYWLLVFLIRRAAKAWVKARLQSAIETRKLMRLRKELASLNNVRVELNNIHEKFKKAIETIEGVRREGNIWRLPLPGSGQDRW